MKNDEVNYGVLIDEPIASDWATGVLDWIDRGVNWQDFSSLGEKQYNAYMDDMACVTRSAINVLEMQLNYLYRNNLLPLKHRQFLEDEGYIVNGLVNCSDRFTAIVSGTTEHGNYGSRVWDSIRHCGLIPEADLPFEGTFKWNEYYIPINEIPKHLLAKGKKFAELFNVEYARLVNKIENYDEELVKKHLRHAPLQIFTRVCSGWHTDRPVKACGAYPTRHATALLHIDKGKHIEDHYNPFQKLLADDYGIPFIYKGIIKPKENDMWDKVDVIKAVWRFLVALGHPGINLQDIVIHKKAKTPDEFISGLISWVKKNAIGKKKIISFIEEEE